MLRCALLRCCVGHRCQLQADWADRFANPSLQTATLLQRQGSQQQLAIELRSLCAGSALDRQRVLALCDGQDASADGPAPAALFPFKSGAVMGSRRCSTGSSALQLQHVPACSPFSNKMLPSPTCLIMPSRVQRRI